jgi:hypothetical protein
LPEAPGLQSFQLEIGLLCCCNWFPFVFICILYCLFLKFKHVSTVNLPRLSSGLPGSLGLQSFHLGITGNCTAGHHLDSSTNTCKSCSKGYYQDKKWQETCIKCNTEETTEKEGSDSKSDCKRE